MMRALMRGSMPAVTHRLCPIPYPGAHLVPNPRNLSDFRTCFNPTLRLDPDPDSDCRYTQRKGRVHGRGL